MYMGASNKRIVLHSRLCNPNTAFEANRKEHK